MSKDLEKETATHSNILAWRTPWTEESGRLQAMDSQRVRHNWATDTHTKCQLKWRQFENSKNSHCFRASNFKEALPVSLQREEKCMIINLHRHFWGSTINQAEKLARYSHLMKLESVHCNGWDQVKTFMKRSRPWRECKDRMWDPFKLA